VAGVRGRIAIMFGLSLWVKRSEGGGLAARPLQGLTQSAIRKQQHALSSYYDMEGCQRRHCPDMGARLRVSQPTQDIRTIEPEPLPAESTSGAVSETKSRAQHKHSASLFTRVP